MPVNQFSYKIITPDGKTFALDPADYVVDIDMDSGLGLPPVDHSTQSLYNLPGALLTGIQVRPRVITIALSLNSQCRADLHNLRAALWNALRWNRTTDSPPAYSTLRYESNLKQADLHVYYAGDTFINAGGDDKVGRDGIKLIAYDPLWYSTTQTSTVLDLQWTDNVSYIIGKIGGTWDAMGNVGASLVNTIVVSSDGDKVYVGGSFSNWAGIANADSIVVYDVSAGTWAALGTGTNGAVYALALDATGNLYAGGSFTTAGGGAASKIAKWDGANWSALGAGLSGGATPAVYALAIDKENGIVYAAGEFTTAGVGAAANIAQWNGAAWSALSTGTDSLVKALLVRSDGTLYVGGGFTTAGGVTVNCIAQWDGSTWAALGSGMAGFPIVYALALDSAQTLYAGGQFTSAGGVSASNIAKWNGTTWAALGLGASSAVWALLADNRGNIYVGGIFASAGGSTLLNRLGMWTGADWAPVDVNLPGAATASAFAIGANNLYIGFNTSGAATGSGTTEVSYGGDQEFFPVIEITGPGVLRWIENYETSKRIIFNCTLNAGETATIDLSSGVKTFTSNWRGNLLPYATLLPVSDFATFALAPDPIAPNSNNSINVWMSGTTGASAVTLKHYNVYLSADKAVS